MAAVVTFIFMYSLLCLRTTLSQIEESEGWNMDKFKEEAAQTFNLVFHKYNHRVRPPLPFIDITVNLTLRHIRYLDLHRQELQTVLDIEMYWNDTRLQWYPVKVQQISANTSNVWTPDIVYTNSVAETKVLYPSSVRINHKGYVTWTKKEVVTTFCSTVPDSWLQNCSILLGFMGNSRNDQTDRFFSNMSSFSVPVNFVNHEWMVTDSQLDLDVFGNQTSRATAIEVNLSLQRLSMLTNSRGGSAKTEDHSSQITCGNMGEYRGKNNGGSRVAVTALWVILLVTATTVDLSCQLSIR